MQNFIAFFPNGDFLLNDKCIKQDSVKQADFISVQKFRVADVHDLLFQSSNMDFFTGSFFDITSRNEAEVEFGDKTVNVVDRCFSCEIACLEN